MAQKGVSLQEVEEELARRSKKKHNLKANQVAILVIRCLQIY